MLEKSGNKKLLRFDGVKKHLGLRLGMGEFK
jgi:hypothetical protein